MRCVILPFLVACSSGVDRSAERFDDNVSGLIGSAQLQRWLSNWPAHRPPGVSGDLVVLQLDEVSGAGKFAKGGEGVRVYHAVELPRVLEARNNGIVAIGRVPGNGILIDSFMRRYAIRPGKDFVVFASGEQTLDSLAHLTRAWLNFRYWGHDPKFLGILQRAVRDALPVEARDDVALPPPLSGTNRVSELASNDFDLVTNAGALREALKETSLLDVRTLEEFEGRAVSSTPLDDTCVGGAPSCAPVFSGRIGNAQHFPRESVLNADNSFKSLAEIDAALRAAGIKNDRTHVVYDTDGSTSAIVTFVLLAVAGVPAQWYPGSFLEWSTLNSKVSALGTDEHSQGERVWTDDSRRVRPLLFDAKTTTTARILEQDQSYKRNPPPLPAIGASGTVCE